MKTNKESDQYHLLTIVHCSEVIKNKLERINYNKTLFDDDFYRDSFIPPMIQIGESMKKLTDQTKNELIESQPEKIIGMRNILAHTYTQVDTNILWNSVTKRVPELYLSINKILEKNYGINLNDEQNSVQINISKVELNKKPKAIIDLSELYKGDKERSDKDYSK